MLFYTFEKGMNELERYYVSQAGSGIAGFREISYQKGRGFFGKLLSGAVHPLLRFLGKNFLKTGANVANDLFDSDDFSLNNVKNIAMKNIKSQAGQVADEVFSKMKGRGRRRKKSKAYTRKIRRASRKRKSIKGRLSLKKNISKNLIF